MDWLIDLWTNKPEAIFGGIVALIVAGIGGWVTLRAARSKSDPRPIDVNQLARDYANESRRAGALESENQQLREQLSQRDEQAEAAVAEAIAELAHQAKQADDPDPFDNALAELRDGRPDAAETLLRQILEDRKSAGEAAWVDAARAARHIGAIAFYYDTQKSLESYQQAVALDPDNTDGWNRLGLLKMRIGDLNRAMTAYEKVLHLGNRVEDRAVIAAATGNLGNLYLTRGDLDQAEAMYRKSLDIEEALGRKEGMANQYGNLGSLLIQRGEKDNGCAMLTDAKRLFAEIGAMGRVEQVAGWIAENNCPDPE